MPKDVAYFKAKYKEAGIDNIKINEKGFISEADMTKFTVALSSAEGIKINPKDAPQHFAVITAKLAVDAFSLPPHSKTPEIEALRQISPELFSSMRKSFDPQHLINIAAHHELDKHPKVKFAINLPQDLGHAIRDAARQELDKHPLLKQLVNLLDGHSEQDHKPKRPLLTPSVQEDHSKPKPTISI